MARKACRTADGIVGISEGFRDWGLRHAQRTLGANDQVFPLGYGLTPFALDELEKARGLWQSVGINFDRPIIAFVGSLTKTFDFEHVLDAASHFETDFPEVQFVIAGEGPARSALLQRTNQSTNVFVPGWIDASMITVLLNESAVALAPYIPRFDFENTIPNKVVEYLAFGVPIATTLTKGEVPSMLRDYSVGLSYDLTSQNLIETLNLLIRGAGTLRGIGDRARTLYRQKFAASEVYTQYSEYLERIVLTGLAR